MRISDWSSDVCSSDLAQLASGRFAAAHHQAAAGCEVVERRKIPHWRLPRPADQRGLGGAGPCVFNGKVRVKEKICPEETVKINIITYLISRIGPKNARQAGLRG